MMRTYPLHVDTFTKILILGGLALFTIVGFGLLVVAFGNTGDAPPWPFAVFWFFLVCMLWYQVLSLPHRIEVSEEGITFISILRRRRVRAAYVESLKPDRGQFGFFVLRHSAGRVRLLAQFDGFHEFVGNLKAANPTIEIRGC